VSGRVAALTAVVCSFASLTGCGSSSASVDPEAAGCIDRWNEDEIALTLGRHAYDGHEVRRALVERIATPQAKNVRTPTTCVVVFAISAGDGESGSLGLVVTRFGWSQLFELGLGDSELDDLQESASERANARLFPDGTLDEG
jgi:hypothetical protein